MRACHFLLVGCLFVGLTSCNDQEAENKTSPNYVETTIGANPQVKITGFRGIEFGKTVEYYQSQGEKFKQIGVKPYAYERVGERNAIGEVDFEYIHYNFKDENRFSGIHARTGGRHKSDVERLLDSLVEKYGKGFREKSYAEFNSDAWIWTLEGADVALTYNTHTKVTDLYIELNSPEYVMRKEK